MGVVSLTIGDAIGKGGYGQVYTCHNKNGDKFAVKIIPNEKKRGIPCLMELIIMQSIIHPYIQNSHNIISTPSEIYIIQDIAISDLAVKTRRSKNKTLPSIRRLRFWCYCLVQAVECLHDEGIIHGDIKAHNVLIFGKEIKLSDFTLANKKWGQSKMRGKAYTSTHRPPEVWNSYGWDYSSDIWALGYTFYEIAYGNLLFSQQEGDESTRLIRSNFCLDQWKIHGLVKPESNLDYVPYYIAPETTDPTYSSFNLLITRMLSYYPNNRPTIQQILLDPFFDEIRDKYRILSYDIVKSHPSNPNYEQNNRERISNKIQFLIPELERKAAVVGYATDIYFKIGYISDSYIRRIVSVWIASKIILGKPLRLPIPECDITPHERKVCQTLRYHLL